jgi:hypothetical protein
MKHTPGPWSLCKHEKDRTAPEFYAVVEQEGCIVAEAHHAGLEWEEYEANALLLAAAPDLLQALKHIMNNAPAPVGGAKLMAERAIAKAEGK